MKKLFYDNDGKTIWSIYSLKFLFFVFIFVHHCYDYVRIPLLRQPSLAVSAFIIISGFLTGLIYINKDIKIKDSIDFSLKRIKKLYPLHLFMLFFMLTKTNLFNITSFTMVFEFLKKLFCNVLLIQSWINDSAYYFSFNGVTWFLSTYLFLSLITIPTMILLKKMNKKNKGILYLILLSFLLFGITLLISHIVTKNGLSEEFYLYIFPPTRMFEYIIGMIFGVLSTKIKLKNSKVLFTILEIVSITALVLFVIYTPEILNISTLISKKFNMWIIPLIFILVVFSQQRGLMSKALSFKPLVYFGEISMFAFLIHQPLIIYFTKSNTVVHYRYFALYMFILTIVISHIINKYYKLKKANREVKKSC